MATNYLTLVNEVLRELNEVELSSANFASATLLQAHVKDMVNRAYMDICLHSKKWPFLAAATSQNEFLGNTYVETVAGTRWYLLNPSRTDKDDDYSHVDWDHFTLTTEGVAGETAPYTNEQLEIITIEEWRNYWKRYEEMDKADSQTYGVPKRVIRNPDNIRFGLSPIPNQVYRIYFYAWSQPTALDLHSDEIVFQDRFVPVLQSRVRYYVWQFKENPQLSAGALNEYQFGISSMRKQLMGEGIKRMHDDRVRFWI